MSRTTTSMCRQAPVVLFQLRSILRRACARRSITTPAPASHSCATTEASTPYSRKPGNKLGMRKSPMAATNVAPPITIPAQPSYVGYKSSTIATPSSSSGRPIIKAIAMRDGP
jgi:hypothetical protein